MPELSIVWVVSNCQARGLTNVWRFLDEFSGNRAGRVLRAARPDLLISLPCADGCLCTPGNRAGDLAFDAPQPSETEVHAFAPAAAQLLRELGWPSLEIPASNGHSKSAAGYERVARLVEEGRIVNLPHLFDSKDVRGAIGYQEFNVLAANVAANGLCTDCGLCIMICPPRALSRRDGAIHMVGDCVYGACGLCFVSCPQLYQALSIMKGCSPEPPVLPAGRWKAKLGLADALAAVRNHLERENRELRWVEFDTAQPGRLSSESKALLARRVSSSVDLRERV